MLKIGPRISEKTAEWITNHFSNKSAGAEYLLEAVPEMYRRTLHGLKGRFRPGELSLMLDCMNGTALTAQLAGQHLLINCVDSMELDGTDTKWSIDRQEFTGRLTSLSIFEAACLEIWAHAFWESDVEEDLENWLRQLA